MVTLLFVIVKRECIRELLILQHAECPTPSASVKSGTFGKHNGLSDHMSLRVDLADIDHENDQVP
jgi:hypothetical protein